MNGGFSSRFKTKEPGDNKGGFRKVKNGAGQATVFGGGGKSGLEMNTVGWILFGIAASVPVLLLLGLFTTMTWPFSLMMASLFFAHLFLGMTSWMMHRAVPARNLSLMLCWGPVLTFIFVNCLMTLF
jgi:hypothetical protein